MVCMDNIGWDIGNNPIAIAEIKKINNNLAMTDLPNQVEKNCNPIQDVQITSHKSLKNCRT
jgi:hypothetical protein